MNEVIFMLNHKKRVVTSSIDSTTSLNDYIRNVANLRGTKAMCHEGGCGACVVSVKAQHPLTKADQIFSVNSCLVSVFSCHGWEITTVEGIGNRRDGYHAIQSRLAGFNGTQCGYCTPGWVMNMYSIYEASNQKITMKEVENSFAGNMCRCTGYRPILDAFKSLASDADPKLRNRVGDIEDLSGIKMCLKNGACCTKCCDDYDRTEGFCMVGMEFSLATEGKDVIKIGHDVVKWFKAFTVDHIFKVFESEGTSSYMLVAGNTAQGVYRVTHQPKVMIDISSVGELKKHVVGGTLVLGGGMSLNEAMHTFLEVSKTNAYFQYLKVLYDHLDLVAHVPVRNIGTIAGNLSIKHKHNEFPSDVFLMLETVGAVITIATNAKHTIDVSTQDFLKLDMTGKVILRISLPPLSEEYSLQTYKIMPRAQNAHAEVNAGFLVKFDENKSLVEEVRIVYGAISSTFIRATATEAFLTGKNLFDSDVLMSTLTILSDEIHPTESLPEPSPQYRKKLALGLFYKFVLHLCPIEKIDPKMVSGGAEFHRALSSGEQKYDTNKELWPLNQPIPKLEALVQCSGEAEFANDMPTLPGEVHAAFVLSRICRGTIDKIDASEALKMDGVVAFFSAKDIPGSNSFTPPIHPVLSEMEEILCTTVKYFGHPIGVVVAETHKLANKAANLVKVTYKDVPNAAPVTSIADALKAPKAENRIFNITTVDPPTPPTDRTDVSKIIKGSYEMYGQYAYTMETQTCVCIPTEGGLDVISATQFMDLINVAIARMLKIPQNQINMKVRRVGGGYGSKLIRSAQIACACALVATLLNRPVRFVLSIEANMAAIGRRSAVTSNYEVGVNDKGVIQYLKNTFYTEFGSSHNETTGFTALEAFSNCYKNDSWYVSVNGASTDIPSTTYHRAPGTIEGIAMIEHIMERIAVETKMDPIAVRIANLAEIDNPIRSLMDTVQESADYDQRLRAVLDFNKSNRWKKKGISLVPMRFNLQYFGNFSLLLAVYQGDGSVAITHAGIEMGQGLNTKVAQVCAHILGIPLESISVKPSTNLTAPNAIATGGSYSSEACCHAAVRACQDLLDRMEPVKKTLKNPSWQELVLKSHNAGVDLTAKHMFVSTNDGVQGYDIWGVTVCEVEVDILTGNHQILRVDIVEDVGESLSPEIDVGQIEGAYIMGIGYWTSEKLIFDKKTGELLSTRTWNYKPPGVKDIPVDFRIQFRKNSPNKFGVLRSKATGEPPLCMAVGVTHAIRMAITAAREDAGFSGGEWFHIDNPYSNENVLLAINTKLQEYRLK